MNIVKWRKIHQTKDIQVFPGYLGLKRGIQQLIGYHMLIVTKRILMGLIVFITFPAGKMWIN